MKSYRAISHLLLLGSFFSFIIYVMINISFEHNLETQQLVTDEDYSQRTKLPTVPTSNSSRPEILAVNRMPNCGGEVLIVLLDWLTRENSFKHYRLKVDTDNQTQLFSKIRDLSATGAKTSFDATFVFEDFPKENIFHISLLRDPLERIASMFYYDSVTPIPGMISSKDNFVKKMEYPSIESCLHNNGSQCHFDHESSPVLPVSYFCGDEDICRIHNSPVALERAKNNVLSHYSVIGDLGDMDATFSVLEHKLPHFFSGASEVFSRMTKSKHWSPSMNIPSMEKWAEERLRSHLKNEYELYNFVKQRLQHQIEEMYRSRANG